MTETVALEILIIVNCCIEKLPLHNRCPVLLRLQTIMKRRGALIENITGDEIFSVHDFFPRKTAIHDFYQKYVPGKVGQGADMVSAKLRERLHAHRDGGVGQGAGADNMGLVCFQDPVDHDKSIQSRVNDDFRFHTNHKFILPVPLRRRQVVIVPLWRGLGEVPCSPHTH